MKPFNPQLFFFFIVHSSSFTFHISYAQEPLSLSDAINRGLKNNFQIQISKANTEIAANNNRWGQAGLLPSITYNLTQNNSLTDQQNPTSFFNGKFTNNSFQNNVDVGWTIFNGFKVWMTKDKLEKLQQQSLGNGVVIVENTVQAIILAYNSCLLEKEKMSVLKKVLSLSKDRYNYVLQKKELGSAVTFDVLQVKTALLTDSSNFVSQEFNYKNAVRTLNLLMGDDAEIQFSLTAQLETTNAIYDVNALKTKMLANNSTLKNQYINQEILKRETDLQEANLYPKINLNTGATNSKTRVNREEQTRTGSTTNYYANFSLSFNLFNGGKTKTNIQNAKIQEKIAQLNTKEMELKMISQLTGLIEKYNTRAVLLNIAKENMNSAELNLQLAKEKFQNGTITSFEYRDVQLNYLNIALSNLTSVYNLIDTNTELMRVTGGIIQ